MKKIFVLVAGLFLCTLFANAQNNVIDNELQTILNQKNDDYIDINIILKAQMSTAELSSLYCKSDSKEVRRELMVNELKKYSQRTQSDVLSFINAEERNDNVIDVKGFWLTNFINCKAKREVIYQLASHPDVASIVYNGEMEVVSDAIEKKSRGVQSSAEIAQHLTQIKADKAWELGYTGKGVIVAVLDSGVNTEHADLKDHLWNGNAQHGYNVVYPGQDPVDTGSHGTHCAGIVCGDGTSGKITGVAPDATLMSIKLYEGTSGLTLERLTRGIEFAVDNKADILSISQGWRGSYATSYRTELRNTFNNLLELGVIAAVACGNDRHDINSYPVPNNVRTPGDCPPPWLHPDQTTQGGLSSVVSVGAVDENNVVSGISSQGPVEWDDYPYNPGMGLIRPDIVAPGEAISLSNDLNELYAKKAGTSQAAPSVAGVMALMLEKNPELTPSDLCRIIETTAVKLSDKKNNETGSGCIDALAAVQAVDFNTSGPYLNVYSFTKEFTPGTNLNLDLTLINNGKGSTSGNTTVTITTNNSSVTIVDGNESLGVMAANATATAKFVVNISTLVADNHKVTFTVNATNGNYSRTFDFVVNISNALLPPNITAQANGTSINLSWDATNNATSYNIYRDEALIANTESTSYLDEGLEYSTLYNYTMTSKRGDLESEHSKPLRVQTNDNANTPAPTNVIANVNDDLVNVSWTNGENCNGSNIYRRDEVSGEETKIAANISGELFTDDSWSTLQDGGIYQYGVANLYSQHGTIYEEGFESTTTSTLYDANNPNWYYYNENGKYNWVVEESFSAGQVNNPTIFTPFMGNKAVFIKSYISNKTYQTYLVTDPMDYTQYGGNELLLSFYYITPAWGSDVNTLRVMASNTYNSGWTELWTSDATNVSDWTKAEVDLSDYIGQNFHIAFVNAAGYGFCTGLDEVAILGDGSKESRIEWSEKIYKNPNTFEHDGLWSDADNWTKKQVPGTNDHLIIINANAIIDSDVEVNSMMINNGSLTINKDVKFTINKDFSNDNADAFIINDGAQVFQTNDNIAATFVMDINNWQLIASPVKNADVDDFMQTLSDLYKYDGTDTEWIEYNESTFQQGIAYLAYNENEIKAKFKGMLNNEKTHEFALSYDNENDLHLIGNPFPFNMNWDNLQKENIAKGYAVINADGSYEYATSGTIKTGDGFFVKAISNNPIVTYNKDYQLDNNTGRLINIIASGDNGKDNLIIYMSDEGHEGFPKLNNLNESIANIYVANNDKRYGIYNYSEDVKEINIDFKANEEGNYTLHIDNDGEFEIITLIDNITGKETNMLLNDYTFNATPQDAYNRFTVRFTNGEGLSANDLHNNFAYHSGNELIINAEGTVQIIDMMGRTVYNNNIINDNNRIDASKFNKATYIIRLINKDGVKMQKVVIY